MPPSQRDLETDRQTERRVAAMHIVKRLAAEEAPVKNGNTCTLCLGINDLDRPTDHKADCPWRMARELVGKPLEQ